MNKSKNAMFFARPMLRPGGSLVLGADLELNVAWTPCLSSINSSHACASTSFSDRISHAPIDAAESLPRWESRSYSRMFSCPASPCTASANGRPVRS